MTALIDTCVFFALYSLRDVHHWDAIALIVHGVEGRWGRIYITNHILDETLTILKYRISEETAKAFIEAFVRKGVIGLIHVDEDMETMALEFFEKNIGKKGFSYTDATTVIVIDSLNIDYLLTFDLRSFGGLVRSIVGPGYWNTLTPEEKDRIREILSNTT